MGRRTGSLLLKNARLVNVFTLEIQHTHILLAGRLVAAVALEYAQARAEELVDLEGRWVAPGLIDGHVHLESSLVSPAEYARGGGAQGVAGVITDPHEIGNVAGVTGIDWLAEASEKLPLEVWITAPSLVPSAPPGDQRGHAGLGRNREAAGSPPGVGAELMSFPSILAAEAGELEKVSLAERSRKSPEGHAPTLMGPALQAYLASGIASDHESTTLEEGRVKLEAGCFLMVREGSTTRDLEALAPLMQPRYGDRIGLVTDDRLPSDLLTEGGVDSLMRKTIGLGADPAYAIRSGNWNVARHYHCCGGGAVAPGFQADLVVLDDLHDFRVQAVYQQGQRVAQAGWGAVVGLFVE